MNAARKIKREAVIQARKSFRQSIKDKTVLMEYNKRFKDGWDAGFTAALDYIKQTKDMPAVGLASSKELSDMVREEKFR